MMFTISPILAVISLLSVPLSIAVTIVIAGRSQKQFVAQWATTGTLNGHVVAHWATNCFCERPAIDDRHRDGQRDAEQRD